MSAAVRDPDLTDLDIGLVVPVLNERDAVGVILDDIRRELAGHTFTILVVDGKSSDGTIEYVEAESKKDPRIQLLVVPKPGPGCRRGGASRAGLKWLLDHTKHKLFADVDADGANPPGELLIAQRVMRQKSADVVIASKYVSGSLVTGRPFARRAGSRTYSLVLRALMDPRLHDYSNSYRLYNRKAAELLQRVQPRYDTPVYLVEMLAVWLSAGLRFAEIPTRYAERVTGGSKVVSGDFLRGAMGAVRVGLAYRLGGYRV